MSKKRKRDPDLQLMQVYEDLAEHDENVRRKAARTLATKIFQPGVTSDDQTKTILTRLFRGMCSGRKAARHGFFGALTELLRHLSLGDAWPAATIVDMLDRLTVPESGTTADDERDHYFGRLFGVAALFKSDILFERPEPPQWRRVLEILCDLAIQKPWMREQCGWVIVDCITTGASEAMEGFAIDAVKVLEAKKIVRSQEGLAIWLTITSRFPGANLPRSVWKYGDPLAVRDVKLLADILKDAHTLPQDDSDTEAQGSASWSPHLHFAWDFVLSELFQEHENPDNDNKNGIGKSSNHERITFEFFWQKVVDESLFSPASSPERKSWGFTLWHKLLITAPQHLLRFTLTPRATSCLVDSLKLPEHLLRHNAVKLSESFHTRVDQGDMVSTSEPSFTASCIRALLRCVDYGNFDQITKTKTIQSFFNSADDRVLKFLSEILKSIAAEDVSDEDDKQIIKRQKTIIDLQFQVVASVLHNAQQKDRSEHPRDLQIARDIMEVWLLESSSMPRPKFYVPELLDTSREHVKERLALAFEHALKLKAVGLMILMDTVLRLKPTDTNQQSLSSKFEESVYTLVQQAWKRLSDLSDRSERQPHSSSTDKSYPGFSDGLCLLYCLILFQIYNGETDAVGILQDVLEYQDRWKPLKTKESRSQAVQDPADAMVEIILSFASRPSKFLRTVTLQIFEAFAPFVTRHGLESLCRILVAKENAQGQQEMFQEENSEMEEGEGSHVGSHHSLDSDVEVEYLSNAEEFTSGDHESTSSSERSAQHPAQDSDKSDDEEDEELAAFDAALASALGTRRLDRADASDSGSSSDADMDDDEMMELDVKLAEVFRARNEQQSRNKKKEAKEAKENVVNFKNRVLDLIELYLRQQQQNPLTLYLIVPLLTLARTSRSKQLADRGCSIWQHFYTRSNKASNVPFLDSGRSVDDAFRVLRSVHNEACMDSSNAHSKVASQASIFLVKVLVNAVPEKIGIVVEIYAATQLRQLTEKKCRVSPTFFADWNNWCQTACEKLAT